VGQDEGVMYILGAGASIGASREPISGIFQELKMPSGAHFFYDLFVRKPTPNNSSSFLNILGLTYEGLEQFIAHTWKLHPERHRNDADEWWNVNIEDVFTHIDTGIKMYSQKSSYRKTFLNLRNELIDFIFYQLALRSLGQRCLHLQKLFIDLQDNDNVVSFNWDTIADSTLEYLEKPHVENYKNFIVSNAKPNYKHIHSKPMLLKLHGSLNWMTCKNKSCNKYGINKLIKGKDDKIVEIKISDYQKCESCGSQMQVNIIPPQSEKIDIYLKSLYHKQWLIVLEKLRSTRKLVFIGYSFPKTDYYAEWLFKQLSYLVDKKDNYSIYDIDVVNPEMNDKNSETSKRYYSIFKGHRVNCYNTLSEYTK